MVLNEAAPLNFSDPAASDGKSSPTRTAKDRWQDVRSAVKLGNAFQTLRAMSPESYIQSGQLNTIKRLGEGAFATVDLCWYTPPQGGEKLQVAVKRLKPDIFFQPADLSAFIKEADLLRKMRHSFIVQYIGVGAMDISSPEAVHASTYLVQEYMAGGTLKKMIFKRQLSTSRAPVYRHVDALRWCTQVARALSYLHRAKPMIIHRDLKLENILMSGPSTATMVAKLADFGLCACVDSWLNRRRTKENDNLSAIGSIQFLASMEPPAKTTGKPLVGMDVTPELPLAEVDSEEVHVPIASPFSNSTHSQPPAADDTNGAATVDKSPAPPTPTEIKQQEDTSQPQQAAGEGGEGLAAFPSKRASSLGQVLRKKLNELGPGGKSIKVPGSETFRLSGHTGSLLYMAPEVYRLEEYNEKVDVFSFAVVMLEVFSGRVLSTVVAPNGFFSEIDHYAARVGIDGYRPHIPECVPEPIAALVQRCWAHRAMERPSMEQVVAELREIEASGALQQADVQAAPAPSCGCF